MNIQNWSNAFNNSPIKNGSKNYYINNQTTPSSPVTRIQPFLGSVIGTGDI